MKKIQLLLICLFTITLANAQGPTLEIVNNSGCALQFTATAYDQGFACTGTSYTTTMTVINGGGTSITWDFGTASWSGTAPTGAVDWIAVRVFTDFVNCGVVPGTPCPRNFLQQATACGVPNINCMNVSVVGGSCVLPCSPTTVTATQSLPCTGCLRVVLN